MKVFRKVLIGSLFVFVTSVCVSGCSAKAKDGGTPKKTQTPTLSQPVASLN